MTTKTENNKNADGEEACLDAVETENFDTGDKVISTAGVNRDPTDRERILRETKDTTNDKPTPKRADPSKVDPGKPVSESPNQQLMGVAGEGNPKNEKNIISGADYKMKGPETKKTKSKD